MVGLPYGEKTMTIC